MARMPGTIWQGEQSPRNRMDRYDIVCVHTIVGYAPAHAAHFSVKADGTIIQSRDTAYRSAANLDGNHRVIAIENEDHGPRFGGTPKLPKWVPLTPEQVEANAKILAWAHKTHGVPLQLNPNSRPTSRGLGYHRQGIDGNFGTYRFPGRVSGGEVWTSSPGKVCPTDARIAQLPEILAQARAIVTPPKPRRQRRRIFRVGVINIPTKVGPKAWAECWEKTAERCGIFGVNEAFSPKAKALYLELAKKHGYSQYGTRRGPNPIFFDRSRWRRIDGTVHKIHGRGEKFSRWPGFNEARYVTDLTLARRGRPDEPQVAILCTHLVPNGSKVTAAFRALARRQSKKVIAQLVRDHQTAGRIVYVIGDTNIAGPFNLGIRSFTWIRPKGIDKVGVALPKGHTLGRTKTDVYPAPTDHKHGVATTAQITKERT